MIIDVFDVRPRAGGGLQELANELEIGIVMAAPVVRRVHELDGQIDAFGRGVGALGRENILFPQDRHMTFDHKARALAGIGDDAFAEDDAFPGLEFHLEGHD